MNSTEGAARPAQASSDRAAPVQHEKALVVGGGTMGSGIAQVLLAAGVEVLLAEVTEAAAAASRDRIASGLERTGETGALDHLTVTAGLPSQLDVSLAIETVPEDEALKREVLRSIEQASTSATLIASNTSCISIEGLGSALADPSRFFGMHFFNPVPKSSLIEIVTGAGLRDDVLERARALVKLLGKEEIVVRDSPGFATSRLGVLLGLEAIRMLEENVASAEDIDRGMELGYRFPMGPLRVTDMVGLDVRLAIADKLAPTLGDRFDAPELLREKVRTGELGKKSGKGFFEW